SRAQQKTRTAGSGDPGEAAGRKVTAGAQIGGSTRSDCYSQVAIFTCLRLGHVADLTGESRSVYVLPCQLAAAGQFASQAIVESAFDISADKGARVRVSRSSNTALMTA